MKVTQGTSSLAREKQNLWLKVCHAKQKKLSDYLTMMSHILRHKDKDIQSNVHNESAGNLHECLCISPLSVGGGWVSSSRDSSRVHLIEMRSIVVLSTV